MTVILDPAPQADGAQTVRWTVVVAVVLTPVLTAVLTPVLTAVLTPVLTAVLEVLDSTIVNVALPHIKAAFGVTSDQTVSIVTSYIVAPIAVMPLTGLLSRRFGRWRWRCATRLIGRGLGEDAR